MWTDPIVAEIHQIRAQMTAQAGDSSQALSREAERAAQAAMQTFGMRWKSKAPSARAATTRLQVDKPQPI